MLCSSLSHDYLPFLQQIICLVCTMWSLGFQLLAICVSVSAGSNLFPSSNTDLALSGFGGSWDANTTYEAGLEYPIVNSSMAGPALTKLWPVRFIDGRGNYTLGAQGVSVPQLCGPKIYVKPQGATPPGGVGCRCC